MGFGAGGPPREHAGEADSGPFMYMGTPGGNAAPHTDAKKTMPAGPAKHSPASPKHLSDTIPDIALIKHLRQLALMAIL